MDDRRHLPHHRCGWTVERGRESERRWTFGGWLVVIPTLLILMLLLAVGGSASAAPVSAPEAGPVAQEQDPAC